MFCLVLFGDFLLCVFGCVVGPTFPWLRGAALPTQLALAMGLWYLLLRWAHWGAYVRGLSLLGFAVPAIWAPLMILGWRRRSNALQLKWDLRGAHEAECVAVAVV